MDQERTVFFVSDRTGITAETLGNTLLTQFDSLHFQRITLPFVDTQEHAREARARIDAQRAQTGVRPLVFSTLVDPDVRAIVAHCDGVFLDFFDAFVRPVEQELGLASSRTLGRSHGLVDPAGYDVRMDTVNFSLGTDDGLAVSRYAKADIILLGVSRSGKTPTCLYLALQFGIRAANYPLTDEDLEPGCLPALLESHRPRLYGLTIDPERLQTIRAARRPGGRYASAVQCRDEVRKAEALFREQGIRFLNTTHLSIEEITTTILHQCKLARRLY
ncbi:MAG: phosphoenolpyruvate synthase regulatory protein [Chromatiales bacterium 21-64-14]|nr:MAG: phosphoenolpyruvate synthase regulatory protein [Chromatiales bacterium 21-64-14]HQU17142.1 pyruvate, water dikinase regulatory protein [Gammaproteobacteria bacterium]